ncbi:MAG: hypothetical protein LBL75_00245 [Rickettsiales bacterium]|nr:hypothetical protein [Rickettsiales bacterium]
MNLDIDELLVWDYDKFGRDFDQLKNYCEYIKVKTLGSVMIDVYPNCKVKDIEGIKDEDILKKYVYFDNGNIKSQRKRTCNFRYYGGVRERLFGVRPLLQKFPLVFIEKNTIMINSHFWYPYRINSSIFIIKMLHYKFLPGFMQDYEKFIKSGIHYNNSSEYSAYMGWVKNNLDNYFYRDGISEALDGKNLIFLVKSLSN